MRRKDDEIMRMRVEVAHDRAGGIHGRQDDLPDVQAQLRDVFYDASHWEQFPAFERATHTRKSRRPGRVLKRFPGMENCQMASHRQRKLERIREGRIAGLREVGRVKDAPNSQYIVCCIHILFPEFTEWQSKYQAISAGNTRSPSRGMNNSSRNSLMTKLYGTVVRKRLQRECGE